VKEYATFSTANIDDWCGGTANYSLTSSRMTLRPTTDPPNGMLQKLVELRWSVVASAIHCDGRDVIYRFILEREVGG
jgi:hypothetical protein